MNAKPKTELNIFVFMQKRISVNGALDNADCANETDKSVDLVFVLAKSCHYI